MARTSAQILADLKRAFPRQVLDAETFGVYLRELNDVPPQLLEVVVQELIRTSEWFPTVRAIREKAAERTLALPGEAEALAQIEARLRHTRENGTAEDAPLVHPLVREAVNHVGGYSSFRSSDDPGVVRGQFGRLYREMRTRAIVEAQVGNLELGTGEQQLDP